MNEFVLLFRSEALPERKFSPGEMQEMMKAWQSWMSGMAAKGQLASSGNRLGGDGKTVKPGNVVINGPYAEIKEMISGYIIVKAETIDGAAELAKGCPMVIGGGGNVEVRNIIPMNA